MTLESDMLHGKTLRKMVLKPGRAEELPEGGHTTADTSVSLEDRSCRSCLQNALVVSTLFLQEVSNKRRLQCFVAVSKVLRKWHGDQNKQLRSAPGGVKWIMEQVCRGGFMCHIWDLTRSVYGDGVLVECGFTVPLARGPWRGNNDMVIDDDEHADGMGQFANALAIARMKRCLHLFGWPLSWARALDKWKTQDVITEFLYDKQVFDSLKRCEHRLKSDELYLDRSVFQLVAVQQHLAALECNQNKFTAEHHDLIAEQFSGVMSTQIVEDMNGVCKNHNEVKGTAHFRRTETAWSKVINGGVVTGRHDFVSVPDLVQMSRTSKLSRASFRPCGKGSIPADDVVTQSPTVPWHSPGVDNYNVRIADLSFMGDCFRSSNKWRSLRMGWLGELFDISHKFVFKLKKSDLTALLGGFHFHNSSVLCLEFAIKTVPKHPLQYWLEPMYKEKPKLVSILDLLSDQVVCCSFTWKSWARQAMEYEKALPWEPALRMFLKGERKPARKLAAENAFFSVPRSTMVRYASYFGISVDKQGSLMDILVSLIMGLLECSEADAVGHAHKRMLQYHEKTSWAKDISQVDAAIDTFDWHDREQVQNEIDRSQRLAAESKQFQTDYVAKRAAAGPPTQHSRQKQKANQYPALPSHIQQKDAKVFLPLVVPSGKGMA